MLVVFHSKILITDKFGMKIQIVDTQSYTCNMHFLQQTWNSQRLNHCLVDQDWGTTLYLWMKYSVLANIMLIGEWIQLRRIGDIGTEAH